MSKPRIEIEEDGHFAEIVPEFANVRADVLAAGSVSGYDPGDWSPQGHPADPGEFVLDHVAEIRLSTEGEIVFDSEFDDCEPNDFLLLAEDLTKHIELDKDIEHVVVSTPLLN